MWTSQQGRHASQPQFFASDTRILLSRGFLRTLDAQTGEKLWDYGDLMKSAISPNGKWNAYNGEYSPHMTDVVPPILPQAEVVIESGRRTKPKSKADRTTRINVGKDDRALAFTFSPEGNILVIGTSRTGYTHNGAHLDIIEVETGKRIDVWPDFERPVIPSPSEQSSSQGYLYLRAALQWSRNGQFLLASWNTCWGKTFTDETKYETNVSLWRMSDGKRLAAHVFQHPSGGPDFLYTGFEVQNDGRVLARSADGRLFLDTGLQSEPLVSLPTETITAATMSLDGSYLVVGTQRGCKPARGSCRFSPDEPIVDPDLDFHECAQIQ